MKFFLIIPLISVILFVFIVIGGIEYFFGSTYPTCDGWVLKSEGHCKMLHMLKLSELYTLNIINGVVFFITALARKKL